MGCIGNKTTPLDVSSHSKWLNSESKIFVLRNRRLCNVFGVRDRCQALGSGCPSHYPHTRPLMDYHYEKSPCRMTRHLCEYYERRAVRPAFLQISAHYRINASFAFLQSGTLAISWQRITIYTVKMICVSSTDRVTFICRINAITICGKCGIERHLS